MDFTKRSYPTALIIIAAMHFGLLLLVLAKPKPPQMGTVSYMDLLPIMQAKPRPAPAAAPDRQAPRPTRAVARLPAERLTVTPDGGAAAAAVAGADAIAAEPAIESVAPDFADGPKRLDLEQLRKQAAKNDSDFKSPLDKVREQELRRKSIETTVAAAAKAGARKDCQNGYTGMGILAIFPILYGTVTDKGCKWK